MGKVRVNHTTVGLVSGCCPCWILVSQSKRYSLYLYQLLFHEVVAVTATTHTAVIYAHSSNLVLCIHMEGLVSKREGGYFLTVPWFKVRMHVVHTLEYTCRPIVVLNSNLLKHIKLYSHRQFIVIESHQALSSIQCVNNIQPDTPMVEAAFLSEQHDHFHLVDYLSAREARNAGSAVVLCLILVDTL